MSEYREAEEKGDILIGDHIETLSPAPNTASKDYGQYIADASDATNQQKSQTIREALHMYRKGIMFSLIFSTAIIMEVSNASTCFATTHYLNRGTILRS
jgi:hypothetical protein